MIIFLLIVLILTLVYSLLIGWLYTGLEPGEKYGRDFQAGVSVVVPFRNEFENIGALIRAIASQEYPRDRIELILVDDHSDDGGASLASKVLEDYPDLCVSLVGMDQKSGKKNALYTGVSRAGHDIILQTDADCIPGPSWVQRSVQPFENQEVAAAAGIVRMAGHSAIQELFSLEFLSLQASGAALVSRGIPVMANGANLAYRKKVWLDHHPGNTNWASGDDVFFIQKLALKDRHTVTYNADSCVDTPAPVSGREFLNQRVRWGSKTPAYPIRSAKYIAYLVAALNTLLVMCFLAGLVLSVEYLAVFVALVGIKSLPDYLLVQKFARISEQRKLLRLFSISALLYPFYIVISGVIILFGTRLQKWKGRPLRI